MEGFCVGLLLVFFMAAAFFAGMNIEEAAIHKEVETFGRMMAQGEVYQCHASTTTDSGL